MCIRQASMFNDLRSRLIAHGFTNIEYNIINMVRGIHKLSALEAVSPNIPVYQETHEDKAVETLGAGKDHFLILDSCNRLIYQVIMPWSFLFYPYVKAAILSAYNDKPCGDCDGHMTNEEGYTTVTIIKHIPLLDIFKATFPEEKQHKKHSHIKGHGHHHHHHIHSHPHHHHHHHHHSYPEYYNFEEKDGHKMSVDEQYDALKSFLSQHLHLLNINNDTFVVHSKGNENDYKKFYNTESSFVNTATEHNTQSDIFGNTVVYTDELTKVPLDTEAIRVEQMEGNVQEGHHTVSKDEVLSQSSPPLQVTLWYPHYHVYNGQRLKDHYFIVLHSKDPKYHGHIVPDTSEDKGIGGTFAGEKEHHINTTHEFHEESLSHSGGSQTHVGVQTDESSLSSSTSVQGHDDTHGLNAIGGSESEHKTDFGSTHTGEHTTHNVEQNFTSGSQNSFGYSYNTSHIETSETHHYSTFGTQSGHNENGIISDNKDISGTTTGAGHDSTISHGTVLTVGHTSQSGVHETAGQTGHGYSTATDSVDKNVGQHHESDKKVTQVHDTINVGKDTQGIHTVTHEEESVNLIETGAHTDATGSVVGQDHNHKRLEGTSSLGTMEETSIHTENTGAILSGSQNQIGGNQHGTNTQSESSAQGDNSQSESSSYSTSQGTSSFSSSSSSSSFSGGRYPSSDDNTIAEDNRDKTVPHEHSGSSQTNLHYHGDQTHHTSVSHDHSIQSSGSHTTGGHSTQIQTSGSDTSGFSGSGGSDSHSTSHTTGGHSTQIQTSGSDTSGFSGSGGSDSHSTSHTTGGHSTQIQTSGSDTSEFSSSGGSDSHSTSHAIGGHGSSGYSTQAHTAGSDSTFKHTAGQISAGLDSGTHTTNHVTSTGHNYSSYGHGSSRNNTYTHSASSHTHGTGAHVAESAKSSGTGHNSGSHGTSTVGQSSYSHTGGLGTHQTSTATQGQVIESIHGGSSTSHGKDGNGKGDYDDRIIFRDNSNEEFDFHKFLEKQEKERKGKTHLRTMDEGDVEPEPIEKTKDGEEMINHYSKILPWIEYPVD